MYSPAQEEPMGAVFMMELSQAVADREPVVGGKRYFRGGLSVVSVKYSSLCSLSHELARAVREVAEARSEARDRNVRETSVPTPSE